MTKRSLDIDVNLDDSNDDHESLKKIKPLSLGLLEIDDNNYSSFYINGNDEKSNNLQSSVIHLRNLCPDIKETELIQLAFPFGKVKKIILLKAKNQGFIEFYEKSAMLNMLNYYTDVQNETSLRGYKIYAQKSNHDTLDTSTIPPAAALIAESTVLTLNSLYDANSTQEKPTNIIRMILEGCTLSIKIDLLFQIFTKFGMIQKIVTFIKNNTFQVLIQFTSPAVSQFARLNLNGHKFLNGLYVIKIDFSKLSELVIKNNNEKMRDFLLYPMDNNDAQYPNIIDSTSVSSIMPHFSGKNYKSVPFSTLTNAYQGLDIISAFPISEMANQHFTILPSITPGFSYHLGNAYASPCLHPILSNQGRDINIANMIGMQGSDILSCGPSNGIGCVLLVNNLNEEKLTPDALFVLFGVYGDVLRVKILYNRRDTGLIQMSTMRQVQLAIMNLDNILLYGKHIHVSLSKYQTIQIPKDNPTVPLSKEYINSPLHRFKKLGSKNYSNIVRPSAILHLSNIPAEIYEADIKKIFQSANYVVQKFKFFQSAKRMALVELANVEAAVSALIALHNFPLNDTHNMRVSFSKSTL